MTGAVKEKSLVNLVVSTGNAPAGGQSPNHILTMFDMSAKLIGNTFVRNIRDADVVY